MAYVCPKPRCSNQVESGVLYFVPREIRRVKDMLLVVGLSQSR